MSKLDKNFLVNMSPLLAAAAVMFMMVLAFDLKSEDKVIGYTSDGLPVLESDVTDAKDLEAPVLVSIPYEVVDNEVIVAFGYGLRLIATYPCNVTPGDIVVPEPGLTEIGISTRFLVQRTLPDGRTMNYTCRVVNIYKAGEDENVKED